VTLLVRRMGPATHRPAVLEKRWRMRSELKSVGAPHWNVDPLPFVWTKTVDDIITKVKRRRSTLDRATEPATQN
jgi:hypothetical protein